MKYWFFDGNDVVGPFTPQELAARADFSVTISLVCPENFSEDGNSWKPAASFADFGPDALSSGSAVFPAGKPAEQVQKESAAEEAALFDKEMDTFLKNPSILAGTAAPAPEGPSLEIPKKPAKPGPIEDYFNNINGEDLGDILGIPDANENSDMNLPRVVDGAFENTTPPLDKEIDSVEISAEQEGEEIDLSIPSPSAQAKEAAEGEEQLSTPVEVSSFSALSSSVEKEDSVVSVPMSEVEEDALVVLPGEKPHQEVADCAVEVEDATASAVASAQVQGPSGEQPAETAAPTQPVEEEVLSTCTLPVIGERENKVSLPTLPVDGAPLVPAVEPSEDVVLPAKELSASQEAVLPASNPAIEPEASASVTDTPQTASAKPDNLATGVQEEPQQKENTPAAATPEEISPSSSPVEPHLNQVKPRLKRTPEIERFLSTQSQIIRRSNQRKADFMLWVLIVLLVIGGGLVLFRFLNSRSFTVTRSALGQRSTPVRAVPAAPAEPVSVAPGALATKTPAPVNPPVLLTTADKALAVVQNYQLPDGKGTIAAYLDRIYKAQLAQGYTGQWSAEALHKNTYIVKYRLSKTRMEPIVYVFQVDMAQQKLTGALNNIALDLLGKI